MSSGKFEFKRGVVVFGNLAILAWILLASLSLAIVDAVYGGPFLALAAVLVFLFLRRIGCYSCYHCKSCTASFGRLSGWFFGNRDTKDLSNKTALTLVAIIYCRLIPIPILFLTVPSIQGFTALKIIILFCLR